MSSTSPAVKSPTAAKKPDRTGKKKPRTPRSPAHTNEAVNKTHAALPKRWNLGRSHFKTEEEYGQWVCTFRPHDNPKSHARRSERYDVDAAARAARKHRKRQNRRDRVGSVWKPMRSQ